MIYPVDGSAPYLAPGLRPEEVGDMSTVVGPFAGDSGAYLIHYRDIPVRIEKIDFATGRRTPWKELAPSDRAGMTRFNDVTVGVDGSSYAYSVSRSIASALYVLEGLR